MGLYSQFADLLDYPDATLERRLDDCASALGAANAAAREQLERFRHEARNAGLASLQESYTATFDMDSRCTLYVGHQLFGENFRRSLFMAHLAEDYRAAAFNGVGQELPDHLPAVLRFIDRRLPGETGRELIDDAVVPAVRNATQALAERNHPYAFVMRALLTIL